LGFDVFTLPAKRLQELAMLQREEEIDSALQEILCLADRLEVPEESSQPLAAPS
jgi:hypothetical protein